MFAESELIPLSALQHLCFCERQCALIHVEQVWIENRFTAVGRIIHDRVDAAKSESRRDVRTAFAVSLRSLRLGLVGKADVVEFHRVEGSKSFNFPFTHWTASYASAEFCAVLTSWDFVRKKMWQ